MSVEIIAPLSGWVRPLETVPDAVFAAGTVGVGAAIDPTSADVLAPVAGVVTLLHRAQHALTVTTDDGLEVLVHVGLDSVTLAGEGFTARIREGDRVRVGQPLITFDADRVARGARSLICPVVITNAERVARLVPASGLVVAGRDVLLRVELAAAATAAAALTAGHASASVRLPNADGLHARPAAVLAARAKRFRADVRLARGADQANAKSVIALLLLGTRRGDELRVEAVGADAAAAVGELVALIESGCGEENATAPRAETAAPRTTAATDDGRLLVGIPASPGLAVGRVQQVRRAAAVVDDRGTGVADERARLEAALEAARREVGALQGRASVADRILDAHLELLADPELIDRTLAGLATGRSAASAWRDACAAYADRLAALDNPLLRAREGDVRDIGERVLAHLAGAQPPPIVVGDDCILVAEELTPSQTAALDRSRVRGFCTSGGGATGHVAIMARSLGIPAVCAIGPAVRDLADGTLVVLDGDAGTLLRAPGADDVARARARLAALASERTAEAAAAHAPALTLDGHRIGVVANIATVADARAAVAAGAEGVGLLRSEFLFAGRATAPTEQEQAQAYRAVAGALGRGRRLVIRTLDVGGDKSLPYLPLPHEDNPFLGVRGIRVSLSHPDLFRVQLRAILAAAALGDVHVMFPMVATLDELRAARRLLDEEARPSGAVVKIGVMVEVPSAALSAARLAPEVDFLSIGSNDLTQYTLAIDRGHPRLAAQFDGLHPAVLRLIAMSVEAAHRHGKWVGVCGGLAGEPAAIPILVGLGVDELSVAVPAIGAVKARIARLSRADCATLAAEAVELGTAAEVRALVAALAGPP